MKRYIFQKNAILIQEKITKAKVGVNLLSPFSNICDRNTLTNRIKM